MTKTLARGLSAAMIAVISSSAFAQVVVQPPAPLVVGAPQPAGNVLRAGTEIMMVTLVELNSKRNRLGERIDLEVRDPVTLNGQTVIPAGTRGIGEITRRKGKGMWGKSGKLEFRPLYIRLGERQIRVSANATRDKGKAGTAGVVAAVAFLPIAGFLVTGTSARIPPRTPFAATLDEDLPVVFAAGAGPQPVVVPVQAPVAVPAVVQQTSAQQ